MNFKKWLPVILRVILGLLFLVAGLDGFFHFFPMPADLPEGVKAFFGAMMNTGYFFQLIKGTEALCGFLLLTGIAVPVALVILAPVIVNIFFFNLFLSPSGVPLSIIIVALEAGLAWQYRSIYRPLFKTKI